VAKIVIVLNASWNVWNFRLPLLRALEEEGHSIEVLAPRDEYSDRLPYPHHHLSLRSRSTNPLTDLQTLFQLWRLFRRIKPDVALLYTVKPNIYGNFAARLAGVRTITNVAGLGAVFVRQGLVTRIVKGLYRSALGLSSRVFFQNEEDRTIFVEHELVAAERTEVLPGSGIDLERFRPVPVDRPQPAPFVFLLTGRMLWDKGVREYVEAARRLLKDGANAEFRLLGFLGADNPQAISSVQMEELTDMPGIVYLGTSDAVENETREAHCAVLPSYREGTPRSLMEAAAMGLPIITTDTPGCRDVVDDGETGFLCAVGDAEDLYLKMQKMLSLDQQEIAEMGSNARQKMEREYDQAIVIKRYKEATITALG
jgi:glycosyltransferase involved in cell wall biosynthesis